MNIFAKRKANQEIDDKMQTAVIAEAYDAPEIAKRNFTKALKIQDRTGASGGKWGWRLNEERDARE